MENSKVFLSRNGKVKVRNIEKCKLLKGPKVQNVMNDIYNDDDDFDIDIGRLGGNGQMVDRQNAVIRTFILKRMAYMEMLLKTLIEDIYL